MSEQRPPTTPGEQEQRLREFGLSEYAARAYLALLKLGTSEARAIARLARVPVAKVYSTLDQLAERGLCVMEPGPPKRFSPIPIGTFVDQLAAQYDARSRSVTDSKADLARLFPLAPTAQMDDRGTFQVLRGRAATVEKLRQLYAARPERVLIHAADGFTRRSTEQSLVQEAHEAGTRIGVLARVDAETLPALDRLAASTTIRAKDAGASNIKVALFDTTSALVTHFVPDDSSNLRGQDVSFFTTEEAIVGALRAFVEHEWERAEEYEEAKRRIASGDPRPVWRTVPAGGAAAAFARLCRDEPASVRALAFATPGVIERELGETCSALVAAGHAVQLGVSVQDTDDLDAADRLAKRGVEVRHDEHARTAGLSVVIVGSWVVFTPRSGDHAAPVDPMVTNDGRFRRAMLALCEERWAVSTPLDARRAEVARYGAATRETRRLAFDEVFDNTTDAVALFDRDARIVFMNQALPTGRGMTPEDMVGRRLPELLSGAERSTQWELVSTAARTRKPVRGIVHLERGDRWFEMEARPVGEDMVLSLARDVTDERRSTANADAAHERAIPFEALVEHTDDPITVLDREFRVAFANPAAAALRGVTPDEMVGRAHAELDPTWLGSERHRAYGKAFLAGRPQRTTFEAAGRWYVEDARPLPNGLLLVSARDFTSEHDAQNDALLVAAQLELALDQEGLSWSVTDMRTQRTRASPALCRLWGFPPDQKEHTRDDLLARVHPDDRERVRASAPTESSTTEERSFRVIRPDGTMAHVHAVSRIVSFGDRGFLVATVRDITARPLAEHRTGWIEMDLDTGRVWRSPSVLAMLGLGSEHASSTARWDGVHPDDVAKLQAAVEHVAAHGSEVTVEHRSRRPDGSWIRFRTTYSLRTEGDGTRKRLVAVTQEIL